MRIDPHCKTAHIPDSKMEILEVSTSLASLTAAIVSIIGGGTFGVLQRLRAKRIEERNREQMLVFIDRADYVSLEHELVDEIAKSVDDRLLMRYMVSSHQAGCDLYMSLVDYYLSLQDNFSFKDLERLCNTGLITYRWQEKYWRGLIAARSENKDTEVPAEFYLPEDQPSRYAYFKNAQKEDKTGT